LKIFQLSIFNCQLGFAMYPFQYTRATNTDAAIRAVAADPRATFLAGGTGLVDLMKLNVETPAAVVDVNRLLPATVDPLPGGGVRIGANVRNSDLAYHPLVERAYPVLSQALLSGASAQLRNMATTAGNLLQRTRCYYFHDTASPCNKRQPGTGCSALHGFNRIHAVLGTSEQCIATHPSDMDVALVALDAVIRTRKPDGTERAIPIDDFYVSYGDDPAKENVLAHGELITAVDLPASPRAASSHYLKVRDRASYEFALASAAVALEVVGGTVRSARVALGGVATKPWRSPEAEAALVGQPARDAAFEAAADAALAGAVPRQFNAYKIELARRTLVRALQTVVANP
jgi:xanthine dehydrogenase YagS FAD-binding subunit